MTYRKIDMSNVILLAGALGFCLPLFGGSGCGELVGATPEQKLSYFQRIGLLSSPTA